MQTVIASHDLQRAMFVHFGCSRPLEKQPVYFKEQPLFLLSHGLYRPNSWRRRDNRGHGCVAPPPYATKVLRWSRHEVR